MSIKRCEDFLADYFGKKHCILTGNGTISLSICYSLMPQGKAKVILPSVVCPNLVYALSYASKEAVFADILGSNATIDPDSVRNLLENDNTIGAIVAVHLYGHQAHMEELRLIADQYNVLLIEDIAQSMGGRDDDGQLLGTIGDCAVASFGSTKIIDVKEGGGVLIDDSRLAKEARKFAGLLPVSNDEDRKKHLSGIYRDLFYSVWDGGTYNAEFYQIFNHFPSIFKELYYVSVSDDSANKILSAFQGLDSKIDHRKKIYNIYRDFLSDIESVVLFDSALNEVSWRFSFQVCPHYRDELVEVVRGAGFDISTWYPCIAIWHTNDGELFPVGKAIEDSVVNLWVDDSHSESMAKSIVKVIGDYFNSK
jgi:dTDP-4-amino-4,6-dideoxygalactose transaminase